MARRLIRIWSIVAALMLIAVCVPSQVSVYAGSDAKASAEKSMHDRLILKSGRVVTGEILEETPESIKMRVVMGKMTAVATYQRSQIVEIERDAVTIGDAKAPVKTVRKDDDESEDEATKSNDDAAVLYVVNFDGFFGYEISKTPLQWAFEEVDEYFDDLDEHGEVKKEFRDKHIVVIKCDTETPPFVGFSGIFMAEDICPVIEDEMDVKGRKVVFWIEKASGGASFMPFISPDIYFTSDGQMAGLADLDEFSSGDKMVDEKLISARIGHAEGFAISGGYKHIGPPIIRAMARTRNWLCVKWVGGEPVFLESEPPEEEAHEWTVLTDNGDGDNEDEFSYKGNDILRVNSDMAVKLGLAKGVCDTYEDLAYELGIEHNYEVVDDSRADKKLKDWSEDIETAWDKANNQNGELWQDFAEVQVGGDYKQRRKARNKKIQILKELYSTHSRFEEVLDPQGQTQDQIQFMIDQLREEQSFDKQGQRRRG